MTRRGTVIAGAAVLVTGVALGAAALGGNGGEAATAAVTGAQPAATAVVTEGKLSAVVSRDGILMYEGKADGSPRTVTNLADGTFTALPKVGDRIGCADPLYRVDDRPVLLLCGPVPAYRDLAPGDAGEDVRELNRSLRVRGAGRQFTARTASALVALQRRHGLPATGTLSLGEIVVLPGAVRIARVVPDAGAAARPGSPVLGITSDRLHVRVDLDPSQRGLVRVGDRARITLPGNRIVAGRVASFGRIAQTPDDRGGNAAAATIPMSIRLSDPSEVRGLDRAPVKVDITTAGVDRALSVPVTALVGHAGGGFAVELVRAGGQRELVAVTTGLFDDSEGRVEVKGRLRAGDRVAVPSL